MAAQKVKLGPLQILTLGTFVGSVQLLAICLGFAAWRFWRHGWTDPAGMATASLVVTMAVLPLDWTTGEPMRKFVRWICGSVAKHYFPVHVIVEGK